MLFVERFRDDAPMSAADAAKVILDGVREERWRILVSEDAKAMDRLVRENPEEAYEPSFMEKLRSVTQWGLGSEGRRGGVGLHKSPCATHTIIIRSIRLPSPITFRSAHMRSPKSFISLVSRALSSRFMNLASKSPSRASVVARNAS